jgi:hypothetical protein
MPNLRQSMAAKESMVTKIEATLVAKFGMKISLRHVGAGVIRKCGVP